MLALPPVDPPSWWRFQIRFGRDHYVRVDTCDYSVDPAAIGRIVAVLTDNHQVIALATGGEIVAQHPAAGPSVREQITPKARDANHVAAHWKEALNLFSLLFEDRLSVQWPQGTYARSQTRPGASPPCADSPDGPATSLSVCWRNCPALSGPAHGWTGRGAGRR